MIQNKTELKGYFLNGSIPNQDNFGDLIDTMVNLTTTNQISTYDSGNVGINETVDSGYNFSVTGNARVTGNTNLIKLAVTDVASLVKGNIGHLGGFTSVPTNTLQSGSGIGATVTITGTDLAGQINLTTGTGCVASVDVIDITFNTIFNSIPFIFLQNANSLTSRLNGNSAIYPTNVTTSGFSLYVGSIKLADVSNYILNYLIVA